MAHNPHTSLAEIMIHKGFDGVLLMGKSVAKSRNAPWSQSEGKCVAPHKVHSGSRSESLKEIFRQNRRFRES